MDGHTLSAVICPGLTYAAVKCKHQSIKFFHCWRYCLDKTRAHQQTALSLSVSKQNKFTCVVLCICCCSCMCVCPCLHAWLCMFIYVSCEEVAVYSCNSCCKFPERPFQFHDNSPCWNTCFSVSLWETFLVHQVKSQASWYSGVCVILTLGNTPVVPKTRKVLAPWNSSYRVSNPSFQLLYWCVYM